MFQFRAKFLQPINTTSTDATTGVAAKTATASHLTSRLLRQRQLRPKHEQRCIHCGLPQS